jgi:HNH endonuclease
MEDLTGKIFNKLTVISFSHKKDWKNYWKCKCSCGKDTIVDHTKIISGHTKSCGCLIKNNKGRKPRIINRDDFLNKRFGKLIITDILKQGSIFKAKCLCDCGKECTPNLHNILRGHTRSCGCNKSVSLIKYSKNHTGKNAKCWKGGLKKSGNGYIYQYCYGHPFAYNNYVSQHRLVMEKKLGRYLFPWEKVHHKNGVRDDNSVNNLELWTKSHPTGSRVADILKWSLEQINLYIPDALKSDPKIYFSKLDLLIINGKVDSGVELFSQDYSI